MKRSFLIGTLIFFAIVVKAQDRPKPPPPPPSIEDRLAKVNELMKEIGPNDKQEAVIYEAFKKFFYDADQLRKDNPPPPPPPPDPKIKVAMDKLEKDRDEAVKKVLTTEQFQKYIEAAKDMRPPAPPKPNDGKKPPPPPSPK